MDGKHQNLKDIFLRKIDLDDYFIITPNKKIEIIINNKILCVKLNDNLTCEIRNKKDRKTTIWINYYKV